MNRKLYYVVAAVVCFFIIFVLGVVITEKENISNLNKSFANSEQEGQSNVVTIAAPSEKMAAYHKSKVIIWIIRLLWGFTIPAIFLFSGLSSGIRKWAWSKGRRTITVMVLYFLIYSIIDFILNLPIEYFGDFVNKHTFDLSNQTFGKWLGDSVKGLILSMFIGAALIWIPYGIIKRSPKRWWLYTGLLTIPLMIFMSYASPIFIDPVFNKYTAIKDTELEAKIYNQINSTVIKDCKVYQVEKSVDTKEMNAYMTGVFNTKRIVLWDTTIKKLSDSEVLCVVAHEMGHYLMGHVWKSIVMSGLLCILVLFLVDKAAVWIIAQSVGAFGFKKLYDIASLPLLLLLLNLFMFLASPAVNAYSRYMETQADTFEIELTGDNYAAATAMVKLHEQSLTLPEPGLVYKLWNYDHPTFKERVDFANSYNPWKEHKPLKYKKFFTKHTEWVNILMRFTVLHVRKGV